MACQTVRHHPVSSGAAMVAPNRGASEHVEPMLCPDVSHSVCSPGKVSNIRTAEDSALVSWWVLVTFADRGSYKVLMFFCGHLMRTCLVVLR